MHDSKSELSSVSPSRLSRFIEKTADTIDGGGATEYSKLSRRELDDMFEVLTSALPAGNEATDRLQRLVHDMQVYRCELEMQNRALREAQEENERAVYRYTELYDSLPIGYVTLMPNGQIVEANATACETLQVTRECLRGSFFQQYVAATDGTVLASHLAACNRSSQRHTMETLLKPRGGPSFVVQLSSCRAFPQAEVGFLIRTAFTDITENKNAHQALRDALTEQEQFTRSLSHDLRGPLVRISNFAHVLTEDHAASLPVEVQDILGRIRRGALQMEELLNNLVQYNRLSRAPAAVDAIDLNEVLRDLQIELQRVIRERAARIEVQHPLPRVLATRALLMPALRNLLTNALKFTVAGKAPVVKISARETDRTVVLTVADEGIGIAPEYHERIFKIFEKLHPDFAYVGTGIGLALVRRAAEHMQGKIWVESQLGMGAQFHLELPKGTSH